MVVSSLSGQNVTPSDRIVPEEVEIGGTSTLDTQQLQEIANSLTALRVGPDEEELRQRIRDAFQQRGYFDADVTGLKVVPLDPLAKPKPVRIEAEVAEGPHFRLSEIRFGGNRALSADELHQLFPLRAGEFFSTAKVRGGFDAMRKEYLALGYLDWSVVPSTDKAGSALVALTLDITEGPQYRMGALEIEGKSDVTRQMRSLWRLETGQPFDLFYPGKFLEENKSLLPPGFNASRDFHTERDCSDFTVLVSVNLDPTRASFVRPDKPCKETAKPQKPEVR
jgi:outer membrane protein assembly factor BamA